MARRQRTDSVAAQASAFRQLKDWPPAWPVETVDRMGRPQDQERAELIFRQIMTSRAPQDFREHDHVLAAQLAVCEVDLAKVTAEIDAEGYTALGGKNGLTRIKNPLLDVAQFFTNRQIQLARALGVVGVGVDLRTVKNGAKAFSVARELDAEIEPTGLLA